MTRPSHDTFGGHVYLELQQRAREEDRGTQELLVHYAHERFLFRLSRSPYRDRLVLKGGMLLATFEARRSTQDIDTLAIGIDNDEANVAAVVAEIATIPVDDGVVYDAGTITTSAIRGDDAYPGVRAAMSAWIDRAKVRLRIDINIGDPVTPGPVEITYPSLLGDPFHLLGYPLATVLAEKIVTLLQRGEVNTRERDVADILTLVRSNDIPRSELRHAIQETAAYRSTELRPLGPIVGRLGEMRQSSWEPFLERSGLVDTLPGSYADAIAGEVAFADDVIASS